MDTNKLINLLDRIDRASHELYRLRDEMVGYLGNEEVWKHEVRNDRYVKAIKYYRAIYKTDLRTSRKAVDKYKESLSKEG